MATTAVEKGDDDGVLPTNQDYLFKKLSLINLPTRGSVKTPGFDSSTFFVQIWPVESRSNDGVCRKDARLTHAAESVTSGPIAKNPSNHKNASSNY
uniref:Uncharacterized protein n=1 Tax=Romanomermis culicivorax TaxID=13658 RepID=A0A915JR57_ROMCU